MTSSALWRMWRSWQDASLGMSLRAWTSLMPFIGILRRGMSRQKAKKKSLKKTQRKQCQDLDIVLPVLREAMRQYGLDLDTSDYVKSPQKQSKTMVFRKYEGNESL